MNQRLHTTLCATALALAASALSAQTFNLPPAGENLVGEVRGVAAHHEDTMLDIGRRNGLGYEEMILANPGVDVWLPGAGTAVVLPTQFILPDAPREGIVLNIPEMRLYYYPKPKKGERAVVITHAVSVGREGWNTPSGVTKVVSKQKDPSWHPPKSIRAEHAAEGDILPEVVPPGPANPLGAYAMRLGFGDYLIHGTNNPAGLGMRVTHGCMRLYPEDIESLFAKVPVGTPVRVVNQPIKAGWKAGVLYVEIHPPLEEQLAQHAESATPLTQAIVAATRERADAQVDWSLAEQLRADPSGIPVAISGMPREAARSDYQGEQRLY